MTLLEPIGLNALTNGQKARLVLNTELEDVALRRETVGGEVAQQRIGHVARMFPARTDLNGEIAMLLTGLVGNDLDAVELQDGAGDALAGFGVEDGGHALFDSNGTGAKGEGIGLAEESGRGRGFEDGQAGVIVEAAGLGRVEGANTECPDRDVRYGQLGVPEGLEKPSRESWGHGFWSV